MVAQAARKGNAAERTLGNGKVTLGALPASQTIRSVSAHMVCLAILGQFLDQFLTSGLCLRAFVERAIASN